MPPTPGPALLAALASAHVARGYYTCRTAFVSSWQCQHLTYRMTSGLCPCHVSPPILTWCGVVPHTSHSGGPCDALTIRGDLAFAAVSWPHHLLQPQCCPADAKGVCKGCEEEEGPSKAPSGPASGSQAMDLTARRSKKKVGSAKRHRRMHAALSGAAHGVQAHHPQVTGCRPYGSLRPLCEAGLHNVALPPHFLAQLPASHCLHHNVWPPSPWLSTATLQLQHTKDTGPATVQ
jgi:hypothetical protein